jgi:hypothetical protein
MREVSLDSTGHRNTPQEVRAGRSKGWSTTRTGRPTTTSSIEIDPPSRLRLGSHRSINALMDTTIGLYKTELVHARRSALVTRQQLETATAAWVRWFNDRRLAC